MGLDVTFFAGNPSTRKARLFGSGIQSYRGAWWVVDYFKIDDENNGCDIEITKEQLCDFVDYASQMFSATNGESIHDAVNDALNGEHGVDWENEKFFVNCWW